MALFTGNYNCTDPIFHPSKGDTDERIDLAVGIGVYVLPIDFGIKVSGLIDEEGSEKFTAPLPVFGLSIEVALTPKSFIRSGAQVFYLEYDNFTGSILEFRTALEYNPLKHVGIDIGTG